MQIETDHREAEPYARFLVGTPFGFPDLAFPEWAASTPARGSSGTKIRPSPLASEAPGTKSGRAQRCLKSRKAAVDHREDRANYAL